MSEIDEMGFIMHTPNLHVEGPVAFHDMACAVCSSRKAIYLLNEGTFHPCWECQDRGWQTVRLPWLVKWLLRKLGRLQ